MSHVLMEQLMMREQEEKKTISLEDETPGPGLDLAALIPEILNAAATFQAGIDEIAATNELAARCSLAKAFIYRDQRGDFQFAAEKFKKCFHIVAAGMEKDVNDGETEENNS